MRCSPKLGSSSAQAEQSEYKECFEKAGDDHQIAATTNVEISEDDGEVIVVMMNLKLTC